MGGYERFWVGEYDGGCGSFENMMFWPDFRDEGGGFVVVLISGNRCVDRRW